MIRGIAALAAFVALAVLVVLGLLDGFDRAVLGAVQAPHATWLDVVASVLTIAGQSEVTGTIALGVAIVRLRARRADWWVPLLLIAVVVIEFLLKIVVVQPAPPHELARSVHFLPFLESPTPYAFPSGHVARVAFLVAALRWPASAAGIAVVLMAVTRIYLAEHWPSDVVGGWLLGFGVAGIATNVRVNRR